MQTWVGISGARPAGLVLSHPLHQQNPHVAYVCQPQAAQMSLAEDHLGLGAV
ncbi:MAG: hypothetical protein ACRDHX_00285 [Chloroflexota bacterium]